MPHLEALLHLLRGEVGNARVAHLALLDQVVDGLHALAEDHLVEGPVDLVEVDVVGVQVPQAALGGV